ncbi:MAG: SCO family protein [Rhodocyclaceae bacterium]|nr:SCO family protein [Rhodocyclaceae bacterium]
MRSIVRTLLASLAILAAGLAAFAAGTDGFRAYTSETVRRIAIREHPRALPDVLLQTARGDRLHVSELRGRWLLVDFIYTRCMTYCTVQGSEFARLQDRLAPLIRSGKVALLSISFDREHDGPAELAAYQQRARDRGDGWIAARPASEHELRVLLRTFGVTTIADGMGGYVHNAAIAVIDPRGRLVAIVDWNAPAEAERYVRDRLGT